MTTSDYKKLKLSLTGRSHYHITVFLVEYDSRNNTAHVGYDVLAL